MSTWAWIVAASLVCLATKLLGYLLPERWVGRPRVQQVTDDATIGLLAGLVAITTLGRGQGIVLDARLAAAAVAIVALRLKAPFLLVIVLGALAAALTRLVV